jgi:uncharacterized protein involved in type VI secretion and phage assembly
MLYGENFRNAGRRPALRQAARGGNHVRRQRCSRAKPPPSGCAAVISCELAASLPFATSTASTWSQRSTTRARRPACCWPGIKSPYGGKRHGDHRATTMTSVAIPSAVQFRPARGHDPPKPRVAGTMSATIDAEGSGEYAELDEYGQYKVQIAFDRTDKGAANKGSARCAWPRRTRAATTACISRCTRAPRCCCRLSTATPTSR